MKRVLILQSFGSTFSPYNLFSSSFQSGLGARLGEGLEFHEIAVTALSSSEPEIESGLAVYLDALGTARPPDLAVVIGGESGRFVMEHRKRLLESTPVLYAGVPLRLVPPGGLTEHDASVPFAIDIPSLMENILQVLPATETAAVVVGTSPHGRFWRAALGRELERWGIRTRDLPPGSTVRFRPPPIWVAFRGPVLAGLGTLAVLAGLVIALNLHRVRLVVAKREVRSLSHRLLTAIEQERRWLSRELHDDISQRLAALAIDTARLGRDPPSGATPASAIEVLREGIESLSSDVHALSHRLHPSLLDDLGLVEALRAEVDRFSKVESIPVELRLDDPVPELPRDTALSLYRVVQEALHNVARHAAAIPTPRQREILQLIAGGKTAKEIGALLGISTRTVESHKYEIMRATGVTTSAELVRLAIRTGIARL